jgi:hypothetical protein
VTSVPCPFHSKMAKVQLRPSVGASRWDIDVNRVAVECVAKTTWTILGFTFFENMIVVCVCRRTS